MNEELRSADDESPVVATRPVAERDEATSSGEALACGQLARHEANGNDADARHQAVSIIQLGCDRETAARFLGLSLDQFSRLAQSDPDFARDLSRAEAAAELSHMRCIQLAAHDPKNWRTSVWWLERMRPDVFKPSKPRTHCESNRSAPWEEIVEAIASKVNDEATRGRLLARLRDTNCPPAAKNRR